MGFTLVNVIAVDTEFQFHFHSFLKHSRVNFITVSRGAFYFPGCVHDALKSTATFCQKKTRSKFECKIHYRLEREGGGEGERERERERVTCRKIEAQNKNT